jgi:hypothetical protein
VEHIPHRPLLDNATCVHDDKPVSEILHNGKVMSDIEHGDVMLPSKSAHGGKDVGLRRSRFIKNDACRLAGECHRNTYPLTLTTRELVRVSVEQPIYVVKSGISKQLHKSRIPIDTSY